MNLLSEMPRPSRFSLTFLTTSAAITLLAFNAPAATIHVPADAPTIQAGVDLATFGDTVEVACGTYTAGATLKDGIVLRSDIGLPNCVTIHVQQTTAALRCIDLTSGVQIQGFRLTAQEDWPWYPRGFFIQNSNVQIQDCEIDDMYRFDWDGGGGDGGGMRIEAASTVALDRCVISNCLSGRGGGIHTLSSHLILTDCEFRNNVAIHEGGGLHASTSTLEINDVLFENNESPYHPGYGLTEGGAISIFDGSSATISASTFLGNAATFSGGAIFSTAATVVITGCLFTDNSVQADRGGAIHLRGGTIQDCIFSKNLAGSYGGALYRYGDETTIIRNCIFDKNVSGFMGAAIHCEGHNMSVESSTLVRSSASHTEGSAIRVGYFNASELDLRNCIIAFSQTGSSATCSVSSLIVAECSDFYANAGGDWVGCVAGQENMNGNISADPLFCDLNNGNYMLNADSPCAPPQSGVCGQIGSLGVGCGAVSVQPSFEQRSWGKIKGLYR